MSKTMATLKIYFCGSIRGGRQNVEYYSTIVNHLKTHGTVLTEIIADPTLTKEDRVPEGQDKACCERSMNWFHEADVVVAEVTSPSLGVGFELGQAVALKKKVLCLFRPDNEQHTRLSAMVRGSESDIFHVKDYSDKAETIKIIDNYFKAHGLLKSQ